jgi:hypothetical protein
MAKIIDINHRRHPKPKVTVAILQAQIAELAEECASRSELLYGLPHVFGELVKIVPPARRAELSHAIFAIAHENLSAQTLRTILICAMVLQDRFLAERSA